MATPLTLKLILAGAAKAVAELKPLDKQSRAAAAGLKQSRDALKLLNGQLAQIDGIRKYQGELTNQSNGLKVLRTNLNSVTRTYGANSAQAVALQAQVAKATAAYDKQRNTLLQLRSAATASGIRNLTADQSRLRSEVTSTHAVIAQQRARLEALANVGARKAKMRETFGKTRAVAGSLAMAGAAGIGTAYGVRRAVDEPLHQIRDYETNTARIESLGLGKEESDRAIEYAKRMKSFGTSMNDNLGLMLDATTAFADVHHAEMVTPTLAKMKFANKAMFGAEKGEENEAKFMDMLKVIEARNGLSSKEEFVKQADMVQRVITATGGRVDSTQWLDFVKRGGIAAKGLSSEAMYYQMEPIVQILSGASAGVGLRGAYQNLYQGRTTKRAAQNLDKYGLIGDKSKVKHDKTGQTSSLDPGALLGSDLFRTNQFEWMEKVLLPQLAKKGISDEKGIVDAIGSIFSNTSASGLFSQMFLMRDQIHKNAKLNAGAFGIDQLDNRARRSLSGQELDAQARFHDAMRDAGAAILPTYISLLGTVTSAMQGVTNFARENPVLASYLGKSVLWLGLLAAGFAAVTLGAAALLGPFAVVRYGLGLFGIKAAVLSPVLTLMSRAIGGVATGIMWLGRALLMNPIGLAVTGIATAAFLIYRYWGPISGFFSGLWDRAKAAFSEFWQYLGGSMPAALATVGAAILNWSPLGLFYRAFAEVMQWFNIELPANFTTFGAQIMQGLVNGITGGLGAVQDAISGAAESTLNWFKEKLGIRSPSRVFMEAGGYIVEGAAIGIDRSLPMLRAAALGLAGATSVGVPAMASTFPLSLDSFDTRPPLAAPAAGRAGAGIVVQGDTITIHITAAPGGDAQGLARAIRAELDKREADKRARMRGAFIDYDN
jgi:hypothetical protein